MGCLKNFGPAQNILGPVKGQGISEFQPLASRKTRVRKTRQNEMRKRSKQNEPNSTSVSGSLCTIVQSKKLVKAQHYIRECNFILRRFDELFYTRSQSSSTSVRTAFSRKKPRTVSKEIEWNRIRQNASLCTLVSLDMIENRRLRRCFDILKSKTNILKSRINDACPF